MNHGILKSKFTLLMGAFLSSLVVLALVLLTSPTMASTAGGIVIRGPEASSSHLQLTVSGEDLVVSGTLEYGEQTGCEVTHGHNALSCPLSGVSQVEVNTGSSSDKIEVLDPLPVHLIYHSGGGSDNFVGNNEPDTCSLEGTKSSSCYGKGGNDVCLSGTSGDGCYGGPGNDVCKGGAGEDKCLGEAGNDRLEGGSGSDHLDGGPGNDYVYGGSSSDHIEGGPGKDYCNGGPGVGRSIGCERGPGK